MTDTTIRYIPPLTYVAVDLEAKEVIAFGETLDIVEKKVSRIVPQGEPINIGFYRLELEACYDEYDEMPYTETLLAEIAKEYR